MNDQPTPAMGATAPLGRSLRDIADLPHSWPRQGIAAVLIVDRFGRERVAPVVVVDFYREAEMP